MLSKNVALVVVFTCLCMCAAIANAATRISCARSATQVRALLDVTPAEMRTLNDATEKLLAFAEVGNAEAAFWVGKAMLQRGTFEDFERSQAFRWLRRAADCGDGAALREVGLQFWLSGKDLKARRALREAIGLGDEPSVPEFAKLVMAGKSTLRDQCFAWDTLRALAEREVYAREVLRKLSADSKFGVGCPQLR